MKAFNVDEEVAWAATDGGARFLDIVAATADARICIECKVFKSEKLIFLLPTLFASFYASYRDVFRDDDKS